MVRSVEARGFSQFLFKSGKLKIMPDSEPSDLIYTEVSTAIQNSFMVLFNLDIGRCVVSQYGIWGVPNYPKLWPKMDILGLTLHKNSIGKVKATMRFIMETKMPITGPNLCVANA